MTSGETEKIVGTFAGLNVERGDRDTPPPVFCKKSLDFAEKKGLEFLKGDKEFVIDCGAKTYGLGWVRSDSF